MSEEETTARVVIVGGGFGGLNVAKALPRAVARVTLVDKTNHHLFQPLLYQVATAGLSPADIATPIRRILRSRPDIDVIMAEVSGVDRAGKRVLLTDGSLPYDYLVIATGAAHSYFGHDDWEGLAPGLKTIEDATEIRSKTLLAFEMAERAATPEERAERLTFAIIGGGPTGIELAGSIAELARKALAGDFRHIHPELARVILIEAGPRLISGFPEKLSERCAADLRSLGVEVLLSAPVTSIDESGITCGEQRIATRNVLWAAGVKASPAAKWLGVEADRTGRVLVDSELRVPNCPSVFVIGDAAAVLDTVGNVLPAVAQPAIQGGRYVAKLITAEIEGKPLSEPFRYRELGILATIGRRRAVADMKRYTVSGFPAWFLWVFIHLWQLVGFRSKILVFIQWIWAYATWERGVRLITGQPDRRQ